MIDAIKKKLAEDLERATDDDAWRQWCGRNIRSLDTCQRNDFDAGFRAARNVLESRVKALEIAVGYLRIQCDHKEPEPRDCDFCEALIKIAAVMGMGE